MDHPPLDALDFLGELDGALQSMGLRRTTEAVPLWELPGSRRGHIIGTVPLEADPGPDRRPPWRPRWIRQLYRVAFVVAWREPVLRQVGAAKSLSREIDVVPAHDVVAAIARTLR